MKLTSILVPRPVCFFIVLSLVVLPIPSLLISFFVKDVKRIEAQVQQLCSHDILGRTNVEIDKRINIAFLLPVLMICVIVIFIFGFVFFIIRTTRREMRLCVELIKQKEATQQAERKCVNKSLAFARASHDVRGSLAGITGLTEISRAKLPPESELMDNLIHMEECTKHLLGIMNSILDTSKIEAGKMQLEEEEFDLQELLESVIDMHYTVGLKKGVDVILEISDDESVTKYSCVKGDRGKLKQILDNLLNNAIKFTSEGHVVLRVSAKKPRFEKETLVSSANSLMMRCFSCLFFQNSRVCCDLETKSSSTQCNPNRMEFVFKVSDTGKGIPKERRKYVFENYIQVKESTIGHEGTGLGLGIVQSLVRLMGGEIEIMDNEAGETGTCFMFNTFFTVCEQKSYGDAREVDLESQSGNTSSYSYQHGRIRVHSPKTEGSCVVLCIQNGERKRMVKKFMERLGIKVVLVQEVGQLSSIFKRFSFRSSSENLDVNGKSERSMPTSRSSSTKSKEIPLSAMDGIENATQVMRRTNTKGTIHFVLILIDTNTASFLEDRRAVAEWRGELCNIDSRVVWIDKSSTPGISIQDLDEPSDVIITKPLHGSRLYEVSRLLPEFGGILHHFSHRSNEDVTYNVRTTLSDPSTSAVVAHMKFKSRSPTIQLASGDVSDSKKLLSGKRVLLVEDNLIQQKVATSILSNLGAEVDICETGAKSVKLVSEGLNDRRKCGALPLQPYDYILMDCQEMDGFEATRRIREEEKKYGVHILVIALTAHAAEEVREIIKNSGMDHYLPKPLRRERLLEAIEILSKRVG